MRGNTHFPSKKLKTTSKHNLFECYRVFFKIFLLSKISQSSYLTELVKIKLKKWLLWETNWLKKNVEREIKNIRKSIKIQWKQEQPNAEAERKQYERPKVKL